MDYLKLDAQLCFPLYALSRTITQHYQPVLKAIDLTYPQYLVMLVLWEENGISVNDIGQRLLLDSGTLTPLLKRLEEKSLVSRTRNPKDERVVLVSLSKKGISLKSKAVSIPEDLKCSLGITEKEVIAVRQMVKNIFKKIKQ